jgi:hypothetical protein
MSCEIAFRCLVVFTFLNRKKMAARFKNQYAVSVLSWQSVAALFQGLGGSSGSVFRIVEYFVIWAF